MADVAELGRLTKAKYPNYADIDDAELGRRVRAKYPQYSHFTDVVSSSESGAPKAPLPGTDLREGKRKTTITEDIAASYKGTIGEAIAPEAARKTADWVARFVGSTGEAMAKTATGLGNILHALGTVADSDTLRGAGGGLASVGKTVEREFRPEKTGGEGVMGQLPEIAGSAIGSMVGFRGAGMLVGKGVEMVAGTGKAGAIANWLATSAVETGTSAGGVYEEELQAGKDAGTAVGAAAKFAAFSGPATAGLNKLGQFNDRIRNPITRILAEIGGEIGQEDSEQLIQNMVTGKPWNSGLPEATVGAVFGSLIGGSAFEHAAVTGIVNDYHEAVKEHGASPETARQVMERRMTEEAPHTAALTTTVQEGNFDPLTEMSGILQGRAKERDAAVDEFLAEHPEYREEVLGKEDATEPPAVDLAGALPYTPTEAVSDQPEEAVSGQPSAVSEQPEKAISSQPSAIRDQNAAEVVSENLDRVGEGSAAIVENMHAAIWDKVQRGETKEGGEESAVLQVAKRIRDRGGMKTPAELRAMVQDYGAIQAKGAERQKALLALVEKYSPQHTTADVPVEAPAVAPPAQPQRVEAGQDADSRTSDTSENPAPADGRTLDSRSQSDNRTDAAKPVTTKHEFSSTQVNLPEDLAGEVRAQAAAIADEDLAEDGRETEPHVTVKYGLHGDDAEQVRKVLADEPPVRVRLGKSSLFENEEADVVKVDVDSPDLHRLNAKIAGSVENTESYPEYKPHVTLGYVKPGRGKKYAGNAELEGREVVLDRVVFSDRQGKRTEIPLGGSSQPSAISGQPKGSQPNGSQQSAVSDQPASVSEKLKAESRKLKAKAAEAQPTLPKLKQRPFAKAVETHGRWEAKLLEAHKAGKSTAFIGKMVDKHAAVLRKHLGDDAGPLTAKEILDDAREMLRSGGTGDAVEQRGSPGVHEGDTRKGTSTSERAEEDERIEAKRPSSGRLDRKSATKARRATSAGVASADLLASPVLRGAELLAAGVRTFREWKARLIAEYGLSIKHKAYSLWAAAKRLWNDETGTLRLDKLAEWYRDSTVKAGIDYFKPIGRRISEQGEGAGAELMRLLGRASDHGEVLAGMLLVKLRDAKISKLDREERFQLLDALEGRIQPDKLSDKVKEVFFAARSVSDELAAIAVDLDVQVMTRSGARSFRQRSEYFPHVIRSTEALKHGPVRRDVLENLVRTKEAVDEKEAETMLNNFIHGVEHGRWDNRILEYLIRTNQAGSRAEALALLQTMRSTIRKHGSLEHSREVRLPFYDPDPARVLPWAASTSAIRLAQIADFGQKGERINAEMLKIRDAGGNEGWVRDQVNRILGLAMDEDSEEKKLSLWLRTAMTFKLSLAQIPNATQGMLNTMLAGDFPALAAGVRGMLTAKGRRFAIESGASIDPVLAEAGRDLGEKRMIDAFLKWTGFSAAEQMNRVFAANAGADLARRLFARIQKRSKGGNSWERQKLEDLGIDVDMALERGALSQGDILLAAKKFSDMTQFRTRVQDQPAAASYKVMWQFKSFAYNQGRLVAKEIIGEWRRGNPDRAIRAMFVLAVFFPLVGDLVRALRDLIKGKDRDFEDGFARYAAAFSEVGSMGIVWDAVRSAEQRRALEFAAGPAPSDLTSLAEDMLTKKSADEKLAALWNYSKRRLIPFGQPLFDRGN